MSLEDFLTTGKIIIDGKEILQISNLPQIDYSELSHEQFQALVGECFSCLMLMVTMSQEPDKTFEWMLKAFKRMNQFRVQASLSDDETVRH